MYVKEELTKQHHSSSLLKLLKMPACSLKNILKYGHVVRRILNVPPKFSCP